MPALTTAEGKPPFQPFCYRSFLFSFFFLMTPLFCPCPFSFFFPSFFFLTNLTDPLSSSSLHPQSPYPVLFHSFLSLLSSLFLLFLLFAFTFFWSHSSPFAYIPVFDYHPLQQQILSSPFLPHSVPEYTLSDLHLLTYSYIQPTCHQQLPPACQCSPPPLLHPPLLLHQ